MKIIEIPKKSGGKRRIVIQDPWLKHDGRLSSYRINKVIDKLDNGHMHGFRPGKSPVTNAMAHVGKQYTLQMDIKDFFDSCTKKKHANILCPFLERKLRINLRPKIRWGTKLLYAAQGLSESPAMANAIFMPVDEEIINSSKAFDPDSIYTRYADDLTISSDSIQALLALRQVIPSIVSGFGFEINSKKTRIQSARYGRRVITGIAVDDKVHVPRRTRRKLRAAAHQCAKARQTVLWLMKYNPGLAAFIWVCYKKQFRHAKGLSEWSKLKPPKQQDYSEQSKCLSTYVKLETKRLLS